MKLKVSVKHIPSTTVASAKGIILELPREAFANPAHPEEAFLMFRRSTPSYCELGNPTYGGRWDITDIITRNKQIDEANVCGYLTGSVQVTETHVRVEAEFTPYGPQKEAAISLMIASDQLCLGARYIKDAYGKIVDVPSWDVVLELPEPAYALNIKSKEV